jgi:hypothetical protein
MYNFVFNLVYRYHKRKKSTSVRFIASMAVAITVFFQLFFLANLFTYLTDIKSIKPISEDYFSNKLYLMPFVAIYFLGFVYFYTHKRAVKIINQYPQDYALLSFKNLIILFLVVLLPLILGVWFLNHNG